MATPAQNTLSFLRGIGRQFLGGIEEVKETVAERAERFFRPTPKLRKRDILREIGVLGVKTREALRVKTEEEAKRVGAVKLPSGEFITIDPFAAIGGIKELE